MPFDGIFLSKIVNDLSILKTGKINKINQISEYEIHLSIRANYQNHCLLISLHPEYSRVHLTKNEYDFPKTPTGFTMFLRKHIEGSIILDITQEKHDRVITFDLLGTNEIGDKTHKKMIVEIMGRVSNLIITENNKILESLKHLNPFDGNYRTIIPGAIYTYPLQTKKAYYEYTKDEIKKIIEEKSYFKNISGISKQFSYYLENISTIDEFYEALHSYHPTLIIGKKCDFYFLDLQYQEGERKYYDSLSLMLDDFYYEKDRKTRIKEKSNDLETMIHRQIDKNKAKLEKLYLDLDNAKQSEQYKIKGELLMANLYNLQKGTKAIVLNYYTNEMEEIPLDPLLSPLENANRYYNKYQKARKSLTHINEQIDITNEEINYFSLLETQIQTANLADCLEIKAELEDYGYLKKTKQMKKTKVPLFDTYKLPTSTIYVGKNNVQNAYLTHKFASGNDLWFHVKDAPGSHVILQGEITEEAIRLAANLAAYHSKLQLSSSVAVDYTSIKYIKKIPGRHNCFVTYTNQHTIYIDPDIEIIKQYKKK